MSKQPTRRADRSLADRIDSLLLDERYGLLVAMLSTVIETVHDSLRAEGLRAAITPVTTSGVSSPMGLGSDSEPVAVELFHEQTYLADSMQFHLELMLRHLPDGVFYIMPTFRGEEADAAHLNQFFHAEAEIAGGYDDVVLLVERLVQSLSRAILSMDQVDFVEQLAGGLAHLAAVAAHTGFPRITYADAVELLGTEPFVEARAGHRTITRRGELELLSRCRSPLWLTHSPAVLVPFYQRELGDGTAAAADLLMPVGGEVVGSGERHLTTDAVSQALATHENDATPYGWYLEMKRLRPLRSAGFGLGIERFLMFALQASDIHDVEIVPTEARRGAPDAREAAP